jgi:hypothetical protein
MEKTASWLSDLKLGLRSLGRAKGLTATVIVTLALGIGANAAMFSLVRAVLLRPLVNRDEAHLIYVRQVADGGNARFSVPEIDDLKARAKMLQSWGWVNPAQCGPGWSADPTSKPWDCVRCWAACSTHTMTAQTPPEQWCSPTGSGRRH